MNDRAVLQSSVQFLHAMIATLLKQPVMNLSPDEASALSRSLCDVADYHKISLTGQIGPLGLYIALGSVAYSIYVPRFAYLAAQKRGAVIDAAPVQIVPGTVEAAAMAEQAPSAPTATMDFSGDIAA